MCDGHVTVLNGHVTVLTGYELGGFTWCKVGHLGNTVSQQSVPVVGPLLSRDTDGPARKWKWSYRLVIGILGYLQGSTRPGISMAVHQCARFNAYPMLCHEKEVKRFAHYLLNSRDKGIHYKPDQTKGLEV